MQIYWTHIKIKNNKKNMVERTSKYGKEQLLRMKQAQKQKRLLEEEKSRKDHELKAALFTGTFGKVFRIFCLVSAIFSLVYLVDSFLEPSYVELKLHHSEEEEVKVIYYQAPVQTTYHHTFIGDNGGMDIFMYKGEYFIAEESGVVEVAVTPIFHKPSVFKVSNAEKTIEKGLFWSLAYWVIAPIFLFILSGLWVFAKPEKNYQFLILGYFNLVIVPILFFMLLIQALGEMNYQGAYEMHISELVLPW